MPDVFEAIADPVRRSLIGRLRTEGPLSISELSEPLAMTRQAVTKHLGVLIQAGLIRTERQGRRRLHHLEAAGLHPVADWIEPYERAWDRRLARLKRHLDDSEDARS